ncbi:hypothetical protein [Cohnella sp. JJ-181]|uniref:hypothetical protein n=1 Tax=Cohnella rhizoplanae TaxID=2974897 RepID=UPI0022FF5A18|nr:hypothetical protein [Cohnella sp. JJ-181]CAI6080412.1 hypothetical protein COHCIP112018_02976 [Cohnella sp. JJ-181]
MNDPKQSGDLAASTEAEYLPDADSKPSGPIPTRQVEDAMNGSMVQDFEDLKRLGRDMERVKTGSELSDEGLVSDPIQEKPESHS